MIDELSALLEVRQKDFDALFDSLTHQIACQGLPSSSLRLHFVRHDNTGRFDLGKIVDTLIAYIDHYCFRAERRQNLDQIDRNKVFLEARKLFRDNPRSGQAGELLIYFFIEAVLHAPQVLKKMPITTNPADERKGSDGVHLRWDQKDEVLEVIFGESKLWSTFSAALGDAFRSMSSFHSSATKELEIRTFTNTFCILPESLKEKVVSYVDGDNKFHSREVHACLIGFDWKEYLCLDDERRSLFVKEFHQRYVSWATKEAVPLLEKRLQSFTHKHLGFEFFFLPFRDVDCFRKTFRKEL